MMWLNDVEFDMPVIDAAEKVICMFDYLLLKVKNAKYENRDFHAEWRHILEEEFSKLIDVVLNYRYGTLNASRNCVKCMKFAITMAHHFPTYGESMD